MTRIRLSRNQENKKGCAALLASFYCRVFLGLGCLMACQISAALAWSVNGDQEPMPVKFVIITMFEIGADEGDQAGEFQLWKTRKALNQRIPFPHSHHDLFYNPETKVLGMVTGIGTAKAASAIMALGLDPRFELSRAYWMVAGIAGIDPENASIGSVAWSSYVVDGDLSHQIDAREIPENWTTGYLARGTKFPFDPERPKSNGEVFKANPDLRDWAYNLTKNVSLINPPQLATASSAYTEHPNAQLPPFVLRGGHIAAMTFWHGTLLNDWANKWVEYWSDGAADYVTSGMEDTGTFQALQYLDKIKKVDVNRLLILRGGSNYTMQPPGVSAAENLIKETKGFAGLDASLENVYRVGSVVMEEVLEHWDRYQTEIPGQK